MAYLERYCDQSGGAATNGGSSAGSAKYSGTGWTASTTTVTATNIGKSPVAVNDLVRLASSTGGYNTNWFKITTINSDNEVVVHAAPGAGDAGYAWAVGGALTFDVGALVAQPGDRWNLKSNAAHVITAQRYIAGGTAGTAASPILIQGYTTTPGDGGVATVNWNYNSGDATGVLRNNAYVIYRDLTFAAATTQTVDCVLYCNSHMMCINLHVTCAGAGANYAIQVANGAVINCYLAGKCVSGNYVAWINCYVYTDKSPAMIIGEGAAIGCVVRRNGSAGTSVGIDINATGARPFLGVRNCTVYGFNDLINVSSNTSAFVPLIMNNLLYNAGAYGVKYSGTANLWLPVLINNAFGACTTADTYGLGDAVTIGSISLTGDPFIDASGGDFRLDNTASQGLACQGVGAPTDINRDSTQDNWLDVGALQVKPAVVPAIADVKSGTVYYDNGGGELTGTYSASGGGTPTFGGRAVRRA